MATHVTGFSPQVGGRVAVSNTVSSTKRSVRMLRRRSSDFFLRSEISGKQGNSENRSDLTGMSSRHIRRTSGKGLTAVPNTSISTSSALTAAPVNVPVECQGIYILSYRSRLF